MAITTWSFAFAVIVRCLLCDDLLLRSCLEVPSNVSNVNNGKGKLLYHAGTTFNKFCQQEVAQPSSPWNLQIGALFP